MNKEIFDINHRVDIKVAILNGDIMFLKKLLDFYDEYYIKENQSEEATINITDLTFSLKLADFKDIPPLFVATIKNDIQAMKLLLHCPTVDINGVIEGNFKCTLWSNYRANVMDCDGWTPLQLAIALVNIDLVKFSILNGAKVNIEYDLNKPDAHSPMFLALLVSNIDIIKELYYNSATIVEEEVSSINEVEQIWFRKIQNWDISELEELAELDLSRYISDDIYTDFTSLQLAIVRSDYAVVSYLIRNGVDVNQKMDSMMMLYDLDDDLKLPEEKKELALRTPLASLTPLHLAAIKNDCMMIKTLLENEANPEAYCDHFKWTPLDYTLKFDCIEAMALLKSSGQVSSQYTPGQVIDKIIEESLKRKDREESLLSEDGDSVFDNWESGISGDVKKPKMIDV